MRPPLSSSTLEFFSGALSTTASALLRGRQAGIKKHALAVVADAGESLVHPPFRGRGKTRSFLGRHLLQEILGHRVHPSSCLGMLQFWRLRWRLRRNRSEEHTSELQSLRHLVCRLLLEKKH